MCHELAHVRGYPDEGDANVIAAFATLMSENPAFQYSGWLNLWLYLRTRELESFSIPVQAATSSTYLHGHERSRSAGLTISSKSFSIGF